DISVLAQRPRAACTNFQLILFSPSPSPSVGHGGLISPKPVSYLQQHNGQYNPYARGLSAYSETPPLSAPLAHPIPHHPSASLFPMPTLGTPFLLARMQRSIVWSLISWTQVLGKRPYWS
ncbi:hypothetical protein BDQ17DRAFT_1460859, partial [Cyathus striatus]